MALPLDQIPTPKSERWKYTNLPRALKNLALAPATFGWSDNVALLNPDAPGKTQYQDTVLWDLNTANAKDIKVLRSNFR